MFRKIQKAAAVFAVIAVVMGSVPAFSAVSEAVSDLGWAALEWATGKLLESAWDYITRTPLDEMKENAEKGNAEAQYALGLMYYSGEKVPKNYAEALKWFRRAGEERGHREAQFFLGVMYGEGIGTPQNYSEAARWYRKSAEQGLASAQYNLGFMYSNGDGVRQDKSEAVNWWRKAAEQGDAKAQYNLGVYVRQRLRSEAGQIRGRELVS